MKSYTFLILRVIFLRFPLLTSLLSVSLSMLGTDSELTTSGELGEVTTV